MAIYLASFFNPKAKQWWTGRQVIFKQIKASGIRDNSKLKTQNSKPKTQNSKLPLIWLHCASLGEFEQGRPLIEKIKKEQPNSQIFLTFFSPSGYNIRKNYPLADYVFYLPLDSKKNAQQFLDLVQPTTAIFIKYEFWYHYLNELHQRNIPTYLISGIFRTSQPFFRWYGHLHRQMLTYFSHLFIQNKASAQLLQSIDIQHFTINGDTRVDRVKSIADHAPTFPLIEQFITTQNVLVVGSSWAADEAILVDFINKNPQLDWQFIFAPHEIDPKNIERLERLFQVKTIRYSEIKSNTQKTINIAKTPTVLHAPKVLIIDNIGMLSSIYQYGKIAYIGGGFGKAIHNILEPIAFNIPVIFGPKHKGFHEALTLVAVGGGFTIKNAAEFSTIFHRLQEEAFYQKAAEQAYDYIEKNQGATEMVYEVLE